MVVDREKVGASETDPVLFPKWSYPLLEGRLVTCLKKLGMELTPARHPVNYVTVDLDQVTIRVRVQILWDQVMPITTITVTYLPRQCRVLATNLRFESAIIGHIECVVLMDRPISHVI